MNESLESLMRSLVSLLRTRTGFLGLGPTYGEIIMSHAIKYGVEKYEGRSVVREAEKVLEEINARNRIF